MRLFADSSPPTKSSSYIKRSKLKLARDFAEMYGINGRKSEWSGYVKKPRFSYGAAIAALPLRSLPSDNVKWFPEKSVTSHGKDDDVGEKLANNTENTVDKQEESWERDSEKLAAIIADAKEFINRLDGKYSESKSFEVVEEEKSFGMETEGEDDEEEVCVLSPAEWNMLPLLHKGEYGSMEKVEKKNMVESQGTKIVDLVGSCFVGTKSDQEIERVNDCELMTETKCGEEQQEHNFMDLEPKYCENHDELINVQIEHEETQRFKVMETLKAFAEQYEKILKERASEFREVNILKSAHIEAGNRVKAMRMCIFGEKRLGHIPGIEIGDEFRFRVELVLVGLHHQYVSGIDYMDVDGKIYATSIVDSGRYDNKATASGILIYCGQGGNPKLGDKAADQKLEKGNLALLNSMEMGYPVRVIYKRKNLIGYKTSSTNNDRDFVYVYDGLYRVFDYKQERDEQSGKLVFKFKLRRLSGQPGTHETSIQSGKPVDRVEVCVLDDVAQGKEKFSVRAVNEVDDELPQRFTYITEIVYPDWYERIEPVGCDCTNDCSHSQECPCVLKNGGKIPFNENGEILRLKPRVHECGPSCKCPSTCMNRVSQHGPRHQLEIFKTELRGWGVRSRNKISPGSFICEYVGELLQDKEAEQRIGNDEYLFDICDSDDEAGGQGEVEGFRDSKLKEDGFAIDAATYGNIGRFINHSCSPNLYAQEVLYDHDDIRMPHIMFFATEEIPCLQELTYDYNYKIDGVRDANGNVKTKDCCCGSRGCTGRMY